jgi:hypothetical protein
MKKGLLFFSFLLFFYFSYSATLTATQNGNWSDPNTWGGTTPAGTADVVTIPAGITVTLTANTQASTLALNGTLIDAGYTLTLSKTNATVMTGSGIHTSTGAGAILFTGNKLIKIQNTPTTTPLTLGNVIINQSAAATGVNNICNIGGGVLIITGTLTLNSSGVFLLNNKTLGLSNAVENPQYFSGSDLYTNTDNTGTLVPALGSITVNNSSAALPNNISSLMNLTVDVKAGNTYTLASALTITPNGTSAGNITVTSGALNTGNYAVTINTGGTGSNTIAPGATLKVAEGGSINFNGQTLAIQSSASGTGNVIGNSSLNGGISGATKVNFQRYIGNSQQWRTVGFPFTNATNISAATLSGFYSSGYSAYYYNEGGDNGNYGSTSSSTYNQGWTAFTSGNNISAKNGLLLIGGTTTSTIQLSGALNSGTQNIALGYSAGNTNHGWNLLANPYASNINWTSISTNNNAGSGSNIDNAVYRFNPNGSYSSYVNGVGVNGGDAVIENGAAFFVHSNGVTNLTIQESDKTTNTPAVSLFGGASSPTAKSIVLLSLAKQGDVAGDEVVLRWGAAPATDNFDKKYDAYDLGRASGADLSVIGNDKTAYSIFHGSALQTKDKENRVIALSTKNLTEGTYRIDASFLADMYDGNEVYLMDHATGQATLLNGATSYSFTVTSAEASKSVNRFSIAFNYKEAVSINANVVQLVGNPSSSNKISVVSGSDFQQLLWQVVDISGRIIQSGTFNQVAKGAILSANTNNLSAGVYFIKLIGDGKVLQTQKWVKQ